MVVFPSTAESLLILKKKNQFIFTINEEWTDPPGGWRRGYKFKNFLVISNNKLNRVEPVRRIRFTNLE